jgi:hypothetical protein
MALDLRIFSCKLNRLCGNCFNAKGIPAAGIGEARAASLFKAKPRQPAMKS